jgi:UPF0716 family protein affecting phage T7 exclusion
MNMFMLASILAAGWAADVIGHRDTVVLANAFLIAGALVARHVARRQRSIARRTRRSRVAASQACAGFCGFCRLSAYTSRSDYLDSQQKSKSLVNVQRA